MSLSLLTPLQFNQLEAVQLRLQNLTADPSTPVSGQAYYNTVSLRPLFHNGTAFLDLTARANHSGTQTSATISDLSSVVHGYTLDTFAAPLADVNLNSRKITNLANGINPTDAINLSQLTAVNANFQLKPDADCATIAALPTYTYANGTAGVGATLTITATGTLTVDGRVTVLNDNVLVLNETGGNAPYNGLYTVTTAGTAGVSAVLTRNIDMNASSLFKGAMVVVLTTSTTQAGAIYLCTVPNPTVGTASISFTNINPTFNYIGDETSVHLNGLTFSIKTTWAGQTSLSTLGTITTGIWNGTTVAAGFGGTGQTAAFVPGAMIYGASATAQGSTAAGTSGQVLLSGGAATPTWGTPSVANGGTGATTAAGAFNNLSPLTTLGDTLYGGAAGVGTRLAGNTTVAKQFLNQTGTGSASAAPTWGALVASDIPSLSGAIITSGTLAVAVGGTGQTTALTPGAVIYGASATAQGQTTVGTAGQILVSGGAATPTWVTSVPVANGGTGATTAAAARANLGATTKFAATVGDGATTSIVVTHNLGTTDVTVDVWDTTSKSRAYPDIQNTSTTTVTLVFAVAPTTGAYRVVVIG